MSRAASLPWWLRTRPLSVSVTRGLVKDPSLDVGAIREDGRILASYYGYVARVADARAVARIVKRYYAIAAARDGGRACAMIAPAVARTMVVDYGRFGAPYLRSARTCEAVLARMFRYRHGELSAPIAVNGVLTRGDRAYAIVQSSRMPASIIALLRAAGGWKIGGPLGGRIPRDK